MSLDNSGGYVDREIEEIEKEAGVKLDKIGITKEEIEGLLNSKSQRVTFAEKSITGVRVSEVLKKFLLVEVEKTKTEFVKCKECSAVYKYRASQGTGTLLKHECKSSGTAKSAKLFTNSKKSDQLVLDSFTKRKVLTAAVDQLNKIITVGLAKDLRPLKSVEGQGFRQIIQAVIQFGATYKPQDLKTVLQHRTMLRKKHLPALVSEKRKQIKEIIQMAPSFPSFAMSMDMWTETNKQRSFLSLTIHLIDGDFKMHNIMLDVSQFEEKHKTTENVRELCLKIIELYCDKSDSKKTLENATAVTDGGSNMINVFQVRLPCYCHRLESVLHWTFIDVTLPDPAKIKEKSDKGNPFPPKKLFRFSEVCPKIKRSLAGVKEIVTYFKKSVSNSELPLKQHVPTRWNSHLIMLKSYQKSSKDVKEILVRKEKYNLVSEIEDEIVDLLIIFLNPFQECSEKFSGDKYPTIHLIAPWFHILKEHIKIKETDIAEIKNLKNQCKLCFEQYCETTDLHYAACMLNPIFKKLKFADQQVRLRAISVLKSYMVATVIPVEPCNNNENSQPLPPKRKKSKLEELEDSDDEDLPQANLQTFDAEVQLYLDLKHEKKGENFDILEYWKLAAQFPKMRNAAMKILAIQASQAANERVFSSTGQTTSARRSELSGSTITGLTFIHKNY